MRLLHIVASLDPTAGGVSQAVRTIITGLAAIGITSEVVSLDANDAVFLAADSFPVHTLGPGRGPWAYNPELLPWLVTNLPRFERVILHGLWLYPGYAVHRALRRVAALYTSEQPLLFVMPHGMLDPYFQRAGGRKLKAWRNWLYWKLIESAVVNEAAGVLFTCETERLLAREPFTPYRPQRELVVGLGVEEPPPSTSAMRAAFLKQCPELQYRPYLLFLSRIHEKKGVELLVQAYTQFCNALASGLGGDTQQPQPVPALVIAGPGLETVYGQYIHRLASNLPVHTTILFPGMLAGDAKWGAFHGCEAFILPSHQENFGIAVVEALACGKPVLISNQVNIWREIDAMDSGIVEDDTLLGTQQLLERWNKTDYSKRNMLNEHAHTAYTRHFAISPVAERMAIALKKLS